MVTLLEIGRLYVLDSILYQYLVVCRPEKEMNRRRDMIANLRSKAKQMASTLNMSNFANRDSLLGPEIKPADVMNRTEGLDNRGLVGFQRQIMRGRFICFKFLTHRKEFHNYESLLM